MPAPASAISSVETKRILVAEDSAITQDLLKLVLTQRGHEVDIVNDGKEAFEALSQRDYDVALLDFHLPEMDGVKVASSYRTQFKDRPGPRFVAVTADVEGLLSHEENCEWFDRVVPKPVDISEICKVIDETQESRSENDPAPSSASKGAETPKNDSSKRIPAVQPAPRTSPLFELDYKYLCYPEDFNAKHLSARALQSSLTQQQFDAILITQATGPEAFAQIWSTKTLHLLPIIDLVGCLTNEADLDCSKLAHDELNKVKDLIEDFHDKRVELHPDLILTDDLGEKIIGRLHVSGRKLTPKYHAGTPSLVKFNLTVPAENVIIEARKLQDSGLLHANFFDRVHVCGSCGSSQFNVREDCPDCHSADLSEQSYLHHFKCAYQGAESDFRQGDHLVCPKCRQELNHFGRDYDKPGTMIRCNSCSHTTSQPDIGFVCLKCSTRTDGDVIQTRDLFSYELSGRGSAFAEAGFAYLGITRTSLRFADLPLDLVIGLNEEAKRYNENGSTFSLLHISYENQREIEREHGPRQFVQIRSQFVENLRTVMNREEASGSSCQTYRGHTYDFAIAGGTQPDALRGQIDQYCQEAGRQLRHDIGATIRVFGAEDLS